MKISFCVITFVAFIAFCFAQIPSNPVNYSLFACQGEYSNFTFCDPRLPTNDRIDSLIAMLSDTELLSQMSIFAAAIPRLGLPSYNYTVEVNHGVTFTNATNFPVPISMTASFNRSMWEHVGITVSTEARAIWNTQSFGSRKILYNLLNSSPSGNGPNVNIMRDPRWGRIEETSGEDPWLTSEYLQFFLQGLTGSELDPLYDSRWDKMTINCKHLAGYDMESDCTQPGQTNCSRVFFNAVLSDQDMEETYLPAFKACVDAQASGVLCAYTAVNGVPSCANDFLLNELLRKEWGLQGYVLPDNNAVLMIWYAHNYTANPIEAVAAAIKGGCDVDTPIDFLVSFSNTSYMQFGPIALEKGLITRQDLELSVRRLLEVRFKVGIFDDPNLLAYNKLGAESIKNQRHIDLAVEAACQGMVLLVNENNLLPFDAKKYFNVALIGGSANLRDTWVGDYSELDDWEKAPSFKQTLQAQGFNVTAEIGANPDDDDDSMFPAAIAAAQNADIIVMGVGYMGNAIEGEGKKHDRVNLTLTGLQSQLVEAMIALNKPLVIFLINGGPIAEPWMYNFSGAIVEAFYPGDQGAIAMANVVTGKCAPAGRLPYTVYPMDYVNQIAKDNMDMRAAPGHTYKFYTGEPIFPFGHGLSYTNFSYTPISSQQVAVNAGETTVFQVNVTNTGNVASDEVVLSFYVPTGEDAPIKVLFGFDRIHLKPGQTKQVNFFQDPMSMSVVDKNGYRYINPGHSKVLIGPLTFHVEIRSNGKHYLPKSAFKKLQEQIVSI